VSDFTVDRSIKGKSCFRFELANGRVAFLMIKTGMFRPEPEVVTMKLGGGDIEIHHKGKIVTAQRENVQKERGE